MDYSRNNDRNSHRLRENREKNLFGGKNKDMELNLDNFPELSTKEQTQEENPETPDIDYALALNKVKINDNNLSKKVPYGWLWITRGPDNRIIYEYGDSPYKKEEQTLNDNMNNVIETMKENWAQYKEKYIELYGEDEYEKNCMHYSEYDADTDTDTDTYAYAHAYEKTNTEYLYPQSTD
jgi:hypothetical protein